MRVHWSPMRYIAYSALTIRVAYCAKTCAQPAFLLLADLYLTLYPGLAAGLLSQLHLLPARGSAIGRSICKEGSLRPCQNSNVLNLKVTAWKRCTPLVIRDNAYVTRLPQYAERSFLLNHALDCQSGRCMMPFERRLVIRGTFWLIDACHMPQPRAGPDLCRPVQA
ncbi:hypothetical protein BJ170DRAFT_358991 [Xylariales sp. AK1849]|nr:hypothetical protein BJ170DRAFT_358991 [Xylariales sp. AK1849]